LVQLLYSVFLLGVAVICKGIYYLSAKCVNFISSVL
jgi:hypothetical protein